MYKLCRSGLLHASCAMMKNLRPNSTEVDYIMKSWRHGCQTGSSRPDMLGLSCITDSHHNRLLAVSSYVLHARVAALMTDYSFCFSLSLCLSPCLLSLCSVTSAVSKHVALRRFRHMCVLCCNMKHVAVADVLAPLLPDISPRLRLEFSFRLGLGVILG